MVNARPLKRERLRSWTGADNQNYGTGTAFLSDCRCELNWNSDILGLIEIISGKTLQ